MIFRQVEEHDLPKIRLLKESDNKRKQLTLSKNNKRMVASTSQTTQFVAIKEDIIIGTITIHHSVNSYMKMYGHVGYFVHPDYRNQGVASFMLSEVKKYAYHHLNLKEIIICCLSDNKASQKVILKNGGVYKDTVYMNTQEIERYVIECFG